MIYATILTLLNKDHPGFVESLLEKIFEAWQGCLKEGKIIECKNGLLLYGELVNIGLFNHFSFLSLLIDLVNEADRYIFPKNPNLGPLQNPETSIRR